MDSHFGWIPQSTPACVVLPALRKSTITFWCQIQWCVILSHCPLLYAVLVIVTPSLTFQDGPFLVFLLLLSMFLFWLLFRLLSPSPTNIFSRIMSHPFPLSCHTSPRGTLNICLFPPSLHGEAVHNLQVYWLTDAPILLSTIAPHPPFTPPPIHFFRPGKTDFHQQCPENLPNPPSTCCQSYIAKECKRHFIESLVPGTIPRGFSYAILFNLPIILRV